MFAWATGDTVGRMDRAQAEDCLTSLRAMRALVAECGGMEGSLDSGIWGQSISTTFLENFFGLLRGDRGMSSTIAGDLDIMSATRMSNAIFIETVASFDRAKVQDLAMSGSVKGSNVMGAGSEDAILSAMATFALDPTKARDKVAEELAAIKKRGRGPKLLLHLLPCALQPTWVS
jgi:hypothetical protein